MCECVESWHVFICTRCERTPKKCVSKDLCLQVCVLIFLNRAESGEQEDPLVAWRVFNFCAYLTVKQHFFSACPWTLIFDKFWTKKGCCSNCRAMRSKMSFWNFQFWSADVRFRKKREQCECWKDAGEDGFSAMPNGPNTIGERLCDLTENVGSYCVLRRKDQKNLFESCVQR